MTGAWILQVRDGQGGGVIERVVGDWASIHDDLDMRVVNSEPGEFKFRLHWSPNERWEPTPPPKGTPIFEGDEEVEHDDPMTVR